MTLLESGYSTATLKKVANNLGHKARQVGEDCSPSDSLELQFILENIDNSGSKEDIISEWVIGWNNTPLSEEATPTAVEGSYDFNTDQPASYEGGRAVLGEEPYVNKVEKEDSIVDYPMLGDNTVHTDEIIEKAISEGKSDKEIKKMLLESLVSKKLQESNAHQDLSIAIKAISSLFNAVSNKEVRNRLAGIKQELRDMVELL